MNNWFSGLKTGGITGYALLDLPLLLIAAIFYPFIEGARYLTTRAYFRHWTNWLFCLPIGAFLSFAGAAMSASHFAANSSTFVWLLYGLGGLAATFFYLWPALYLAIVKPAWKLAELVWDAVQVVSKKHAGPFFSGLVKFLGLLPGSSQAWHTVTETRAKSWVNNTLQGLFVVGSGYFGWKLGVIAHALVTSVLPATLGWAIVWPLSFGAGLLAFLTVCGTLWTLVEYGKIPFIGATLGVGNTIAFAKPLAALGASLGLTGGLVYVAHAVSFVLFVAYAFPLAYIVLSGGFVKWLVDQIKPLAEKAYDDKDKDYRKFFHHVCNLAATAGISVAAYLICGTLGLSFAVTVAVTAIAAVVAYLEVFDLIDHSAGTALIGTVASLYVMWLIGSNYVAAGYMGGLWGAVPTSLVLGLIFGSVVFPLAYLAVKAVLHGLKISYLGKPLDAVHKQANEVARKVTRHLKKAYDSTYSDRTGYQAWFLHVCNFAFTAAAYFAATYFLGTGALGITLGVLAAFGTYCLGGEFLTGWSGGIRCVGSLTAIVAAIGTGAVIYNGGYSLWIVIPTAMTAGSLAYSLAFPLGYLGLRLIANPLFASWSSAILVKLHSFAWGFFEVFWDKFVVALDLIVKVLAPFWRVIGSAFSKVAAIYASIRDRINGRASR